MMPAPLQFSCWAALCAKTCQHSPSAINAFLASCLSSLIIVCQKILGDFARLAAQGGAAGRGLRGVGQPIHAAPSIRADLFGRFKIIDFRGSAFGAVGGTGLAAEVGFFGHGRSPSTLSAGIGLGDRFEYRNLVRLSIWKPNAPRTALRPNQRVDLAGASPAQVQQVDGRALGAK